MSTLRTGQILANTYGLRCGVLVPIKQRVLHFSIVEEIVEQIHGHFCCVTSVNLVEASCLDHGDRGRSVFREPPGHGQTSSSAADNHIVERLSRPAVRAEVGAEQVSRLDAAIHLSRFVLKAEHGSKRWNGSKGGRQIRLRRSSCDANDWKASHGGDESPSTHYCDGQCRSSWRKVTWRRTRGAGSRLINNLLSLAHIGMLGWTPRCCIGVSDAESDRASSERRGSRG
jgi:hypothetical protein